MADPIRPTAPAPTPAGPQGYTIRPPQPAADPAPSAPAPTPQAVAPTTAPTTATVIAEPTVIGRLTENGAVLGAAVLLALAVVFFLLRGALRSHLIGQRASIAAASAASWALFSLLFTLAFTVTFGLLGSLWTVPGFIVPLALLSLLLLALFAWLLSAATRKTR